MKYQLAPSILDADFSCLREILLMLENSKIDAIHLDVMDGKYVPNISFGPMIVETVSKNSSIPLSVHLMVENPENIISNFSDVMDKEDCLIVHVEACKHLDNTLQTIINYGIKAGVALNPSTSLDSVEYIIEKLDTILIMTVNPGFGGQKFIPSMMSKINKARKLVNKTKKNINIQVDGGINRKNILSICEAGANVIVVGSEIFKSKSPENIIKNIKQILS